VTHRHRLTQVQPNHQTKETVMLSGFENPFHLLIIALVVLMLFGAKRLPEMGRALGTGMREFKDGVLGRDQCAPGGAVPEQSSEAGDRSRRATPAG
jgi:sec-independent protein translocase protein TatA